MSGILQPADGDGRLVLQLWDIGGSFGPLMDLLEIMRS